MYSLITYSILLYYILYFLLISLFDSWFYWCVIYLYTIHIENISPSGRIMYTTGGTAKEHSLCHFPFDAISYHPSDGKYHVQTHQYCAYSSGESKPWCSIGPQMWKDNSSSLWGYCDLDKGSLFESCTVICILILLRTWFMCYPIF